MKPIQILSNSFTGGLWEIREELLRKSSTGDILNRNNLIRHRLPFRFMFWDPQGLIDRFGGQTNYFYMIAIFFLVILLNSYLFATILEYQTIFNNILRTTLEISLLIISSHKIRTFHRENNRINLSKRLLKSINIVWIDRTWCWSRFVFNLNIDEMNYSAKNW